MLKKYSEIDISIWNLLKCDIHITDAEQNFCLIGILRDFSTDFTFVTYNNKSFGSKFYEYVVNKQRCD